MLHPRLAQVLHESKKALTSELALSTYNRYKQKAKDSSYNTMGSPKKGLGHHELTSQGKVVEPRDRRQSRVTGMNRADSLIRRKAGLPETCNDRMPIVRKKLGLAELSKDTLASYKSKAYGDLDNRIDRAANDYLSDKYKEDPAKYNKNSREFRRMYDKRNRGINRASEKLGENKTTKYFKNKVGQDAAVDTAKNVYGRGEKKKKTTDHYASRSVKDIKFGNRKLDSDSHKKSKTGSGHQAKPSQTKIDNLKAKYKAPK